MTSGPVAATPADMPPGQPGDQPWPSRCRAGPAGRRTVDLRLVLPAMATWAGAFVGTAAWRSPLPAGLVAGVSAGVLAGRPARRGGPDLAGRPARTAACCAALLTVGALAGGVAAGSLAVLAALQGPVDELAAARATVSGRATVVGDPVRPAAVVAGSRRAPPLLVVPLRLETVQARGRAVRVRSRVVGLLHGAGGGPPC